jgi:hypothetical protein
MAVARLPKILCGFIRWSEAGPARTRCTCMTVWVHDIPPIDPLN